jgi:hypothetical protein
MLLCRYVDGQRRCAVSGHQPPAVNILPICYEMVGEGRCMLYAVAWLAHCCNHKIPLLQPRTVCI